MNNIRDNLFGSGPRGGGGRASQQPPPQPQRPGYGPPPTAPGYNPQPPRQAAPPQRVPVGQGQRMPPKQLQIAKVDDRNLSNRLIFANVLVLQPAIYLLRTNST